MSRKANTAARASDEQPASNIGAAAESAAEQRRHTNRFLALFLGIPALILALMIAHYVWS